MLQLDLFNVSIFGLCILLSAFFSSSEVALISITRAKVRTLVNDGRSGADQLFKLKHNQDHIQITILIGNTIVIVAGMPPGTPGSTNSIRVHTVGETGDYKV